VHHFCAIAEVFIYFPARLGGRMAPGRVLDGRAENGRAGPGVPREPARLDAAPTWETRSCWEPVVTLYVLSLDVRNLAGER
jgi:hypothetical protein